MLLNEFERMAVAAGYQTIAVEAHEDKRLGATLAPQLRRVLFDLDRLAGAGDKVRRGLAVLRGFVGAIKVRVGEVDIGLDIEPERTCVGQWRSGERLAGLVLGRGGRRDRAWKCGCHPD